MALTATLKNPTYGYQKDGVVSVSATLEIADGETIIATSGVSTATNFTVDGWADRVKESLKAQADAYIAQMKYMLGLVAAVYPTASTPQEAVNQLTAEITITI